MRFIVKGNVVDKLPETPEEFTQFRLQYDSDTVYELLSRFTYRETRIWYETVCEKYPEYVHCEKNLVTDRHFLCGVFVLETFA